MTCFKMQGNFLKNVVLLHGAQLHPDDQLGLGGHVLEDVGLQPPQHVRPQQVVELLDLVLLGDVGEFLQEAFEVAVRRDGLGEGLVMVLVIQLLELLSDHQ